MGNRGRQFRSDTPRAETAPTAPPPADTLTAAAGFFISTHEYHRSIVDWVRPWLEADDRVICLPQPDSARALIEQFREGDEVLRQGRSQRRLLVRPIAPPTDTSRPPLYGLMHALQRVLTGDDPQALRHTHLLVDAAVFTRTVSLTTVAGAVRDYAAQLGFGLLMLYDRRRFSPDELNHVIEFWPGVFTSGTTRPNPYFISRLDHGGDSLRQRLERIEQWMPALDTAPNADPDLASTDNALRWLTRVFDATADAIVVTDTGGRIQRVNSTFASMTGYNPEEVRGQNVRLLRSDKHDATVYHNLWATIRAGKTWSQRLINRRKDGSNYHVALTISPIFDDDEKITGYVGVQRDITEDVRREEQFRRYAKTITSANMELEAQKQQLEAQKEQLQEQREALEATNMALEQTSLRAEESSRSKSEFLANMSHEIRTPMTAILGFAETLLDPTLSERERREGVQTIRRNGEYLLSILNDILDLSKVEAGKLELATVATSPFRIISEVIGLMQVRAQDKGLTLRVTYDGPLPQRIQTDPIRVRQILINLIGNAIKFSDDGLVELNAGLVQNADHPQLHFRISDQGIGMTQEQIKRLFQPFSQVDASATRRHGGTGLGLIITKRLSEALGGGITVTSTPGIGSIFEVAVATGPLHDVAMIDAATAAAQEPDQTLTPTAPTVFERPIRILVAEDGPDNQRLISHVLRKAGADVLVVENGELAVRWALEPDGQASFDVVLMDMQMPVLDGYQATRQLREGGFDRPIIALTAHAMATDRQRCLDAGCNEYVTKPIQRSRLVQAIHQLVAQAENHK